MKRHPADLDVGKTRALPIEEVHKRDGIAD
jgi:hypothetical protein